MIETMLKTSVVTFQASTLSARSRVARPHSERCSSISKKMTDVSSWTGALLVFLLVLVVVGLLMAMRELSSADEYASTKMKKIKKSSKRDFRLDAWKKWSLPSEQREDTKIFTEELDIFEHPNNLLPTDPQVRNPVTRSPTGWGSPVGGFSPQSWSFVDRLCDSTNPSNTSWMLVLPLRVVCRKPPARQETPLDSCLWSWESYSLVQRRNSHSS